MGARQVIQEIDQALRALIRAEAFADRDVEVVFDAPTKEWAGRRNAPTVDVYLYDIREDMRRRDRGVENEYDGNGRIVGRHLPPRHFKLSYLVTAWTQRPEDEHRLLSALLTCFLRHDAIPAELLAAPLSDLGLPVPLVGRPAAARGPRLRRRLVGARGRAEAVAGRRGHRPDRHRPAPRDRAAGRPAAPDGHRRSGRVARAGDEGRPARRGRRELRASSDAATAPGVGARAPVRAGRAGRGAGARDGRAPAPRRPRARRPVPRALPHRRRRRPAARRPHPRARRATTRSSTGRRARPPGRVPAAARCRRPAA